MNGLTLSVKVLKIRQQGGEACIEMKEVEGVLQPIQSKKLLSSANINSGKLLKLFCRSILHLTFLIVLSNPPNLNREL
jgi:hypothetical protein